jgi:hypothetical protein
VDVSAYLNGSENGLLSAVVSEILGTNGVTATGA